MLDVVTMGETMVQLTPTRTGLLRYATQFERFVAGAESNVAVGLVRLGHPAGWIGRVGADEFGACVEAAIRGEGVDTSAVIHDDEAPTGVYFKERRRPSTTRVAYYRAGSAGSRLASEDIDPDYVGQAAFVHLTGITPALSATCREAMWAVLRIASEQDVRVSFDPNVRTGLWTKEEAREVLLDMVPHTDLILTGADEARLLTETDAPEEAAHALQAMGVEQVVVRLEAEGALALDPAGAVVRRSAISVDVVEPVGAGDAFNAGFLSGQLRGWDTGASLQLGNIMGGLATTAPGDVEALPTWDEVRTYLERGMDRAES